MDRKGLLGSVTASVHLVLKNEMRAKYRFEPAMFCCYVVSEVWTLVNCNAKFP